MSKGAGRKGSELKGKKSQKVRISGVKCDCCLEPCVLGKGIRP